VTAHTAAYASDSTQRVAAPSAALGTATPDSVQQVLRSPGQSLDGTTRSAMESRFGHDFSQVRVHADPLAAESARAVGARAYTVGRHVVSGEGPLSASHPAQARLLAHELTHVVQQGDAEIGSRERLPVSRGRHDPAEAEAERAARAVAEGQAPRVSAGQHGPAVQRQEESEEADDEYTLNWPTSTYRPTFLPPNMFQSSYSLTLDPEIQAQARAAMYLNSVLSPDSVRLGLLDLDWDSILGTPPPLWLTAPALPAPAPLVPRGAGPSEPRAATPGDLFGAVMRIPAVDSALTTLRTDAESRLRADWEALSTGERVLVVSHTAIVGGTALAAVLAHEETRDFALGLIQDRSLPVPGVTGLTFQFNATGPNPSVRFDLNVGALLPEAWGFK
jgi:hypothetical protein